MKRNFLTRHGIGNTYKKINYTYNYCKSNEQVSVLQEYQVEIVVQYVNLNEKVRELMQPSEPMI